MARETVDILLKINAQAGAQFQKMMNTQSQAAANVLSGISGVSPSGKAIINPAVNSTQLTKDAKNLNEIMKFMTNYKKLIDNVYGEEIAMRKENLKQMKATMMQERTNISRAKISAARSGIRDDNSYINTIDRRKARLDKDREASGGEETANIKRRQNALNNLVTGYTAMSQKHRASSVELATISRELKRTKIETLGLRGAIDDQNNSWSRFRHIGVWRLLSSVRNTILLLSFATAVWVTQITKAISAQRNFEKAMVGLGALAMKTGQNLGETTKAAQMLASDGLMDITDAATGLKNLLASGFSLPEATKLMMGFKDSAAFARQGALKYGEAIVGATEGIKNANSILVDNAGITKNISVILREAGLSQEDFTRITTDAGVRTKFLNGILKETGLFAGDAQRLISTYEGSLSRLDAQNEKTYRSLGRLVTPAMKDFNNILFEASQNLEIAFNEDKNNIIGNFKTALNAVALVLKTILSALTSINSLTSKLSEFTGTNVSQTLIGGLSILMLKKMLMEPIGGSIHKMGNIELDRRRLNEFAARERGVGGSLSMDKGMPLNPAALRSFNKEYAAFVQMEKDHIARQSGIGLTSTKIAAKEMKNMSTSAIEGIVALNLKTMTLKNSFQILKFTAVFALKSIGMAVKSLLVEFLPILLIMTGLSYAYGKFMEKQREEEARIQTIYERNEKLKALIMDNISIEIQQRKQAIENLKIQDNINDTYKERREHLERIAVLESRSLRAASGGFDRYPIMDKVPEQNRVTLNEDALYIGGQSFADLNTLEGAKKAAEETRRLYQLAYDAFANYDKLVSSKTKGGKSGIFSEYKDMQNKTVNKKQLDLVKLFGSQEDLLKYANALSGMNAVLEKIQRTMETPPANPKSYADFFKEISDNDQIKKEFEKVSNDIALSGLTGLTKASQEISNQADEFFIDYRNNVLKNINGAFSPEEVAAFEQALDEKKAQYRDVLFSAKEADVTANFTKRTADLNKQLSLLGSSEITKGISDLRTELEEMLGSDFITTYSIEIEKLLATFRKLKEAERDIDLKKQFEELFDEVKLRQGNVILRQYFDNMKDGGNSAYYTNIALLEFDKIIKDTNETLRDTRRTPIFYTQKEMDEKIGKAEELRSKIIELKMQMEFMRGRTPTSELDSLLSVAYLAKLADAIKLTEDQFRELMKIIGESKTLGEQFGEILRNGVENAITSLTPAIEDALTTSFIEIPKQVRDAQNEVNKALKDGEITYVEHQQRMLDIDRQVHQSKIAMIIEMADTVVAQTLKMMAVEMQRLYIAQAMQAIKSGASLGSVIPGLGIALALGGAAALIGFGSNAAKNANAASIGEFGDSTSAKSSANRRATAGIQAPIQNLTIIPTLTITAGNDVYIGSGSVEEFTHIWGENTKTIIKEAVETGEIRFKQ